MNRSLQGTAISAEVLEEREPEFDVAVIGPHERHADGAENQTDRDVGTRPVRSGAGNVKTRERSNSVPTPA